MPASSAWQRAGDLGQHHVPGARDSPGGTAARVGYQGLSLRSSIQRQSAALGSMIHDRLGQRPGQVPHRGIHRHHHVEVLDHRRGLAEILQVGGQVGHAAELPHDGQVRAPASASAATRTRRRGRLGDRPQPRQRQRAPPVVRMRRAAGPGQADALARRKLGGEPLPPRRDARRIGLQIRHLAPGSSPAGSGTGRAGWTAGNAPRGPARRSSGGSTASRPGMFCRIGPISAEHPSTTSSHSVRRPSGCSGRTGWCRHSPGRPPAGCAPSGSRMPFQCAEVIFGMVFLPASVSLRHSYSSQPGSKSPIASRFCASARCPSAWSCFWPERAQQAGDRPLPVVHVDEDQRQVDQVVGVRRVQPHRLLPRRQRLLHAVGGAAERGQMRVPARIARPQLDRAVAAGRCPSPDRSARR